MTTGKRDPFGWDVAGGHAGDAGVPDTLRSIESAPEAAVTAAAELDGEQAPVYCEPQPLVAVSDHKTIEVETVKLADEIDPRKLPTELRLQRPAGATPLESGWPPSESPPSDVVVVTSRPPLGPRRKWRGPALVFLLLAALCVLVLARRGAFRSTTGEHAPSVASTAQPGAIAQQGASAQPGAVAPEGAALQGAEPPSAAAPVAVPPAAVDVAPITSASESIPSSSGQGAAHRASHAVRAVPKTKIPSSASDRALSPSNASQPKRAIY